MKQWSVLALSVAILVVCLPSTWAEETPAVLGALEIRGLDGLAAAGFELTKAAGNPTPKEALALMLYGALGTMPGMGILPEGKVRAVWFDNGTAKGGTALLLPVENGGADYLANLGQAGWSQESETTEGVQHFIPPDGAGLAWDDVYFQKTGPAALLAAASADDLAKAGQALAGAPSVLPVEGDAAVQIHPAALAKIFGSKIEETIDKSMAENPQVPAESAKLGRLTFQGYLAVAKQLEAVVFGLGVADGQINIHTRVAPVAGSTLAQWLTTVKTAAPAASAVNLPGALYAETLHVGDLNLLGPAYFRYMEAMLGLMPQSADPGFLPKYMDNLKTAWAQLGSDFGIALMTPTKGKPLRAAEYLALKDVAGVRDITRNMIQSENELMKAMASDTNLPVPFQFNLAAGEPREHRGIAIDALTYSLAPAQELAAVWPEDLPKQLAVEMAWLPNGVVVTVGDSGLTDQVVDRALDGGAEPITDLPAWRELFPAPEKDLTAVAHLALFDLLRSYLGIVDAYTGQATADFVPAGPGNLEGASYLALGGAMSRVRFHLADIAAIGQKLQEAREKAMAEMMKSMEAQGEMQIDVDDDFESMDEAEYEEYNAGADLPEGGEEAVPAGGQGEPKPPTDTEPAPPLESPVSPDSE